MDPYYRGPPDPYARRPPPGDHRYMRPSLDRYPPPHDPYYRPRPDPYYRERDDYYERRAPGYYERPPLLGAEPSYLPPATGLLIASCRVGLICSGRPYPPPANYPRVYCYVAPRIVTFLHSTSSHCAAAACTAPGTGTSTTTSAAFVSSQFLSHLNLCRV